jgi:V8-like Glu-specific endopeptidase
MSFSSSQYPYDTVVEINDADGPYDVQGSGVLIAPNLVLTAAHVVWDTEFGPASDIEVTPAAYDGTAPYGSSAAAVVNFNEVDDASDVESEQQSQEDFALIKLETPFTSIGAMTLEANYAGGNVNVTGYPASADGAMVDSLQTVTQDPYYALLDGANLGPGSSGGPVWYAGSDDLPEVVGLVSTGNGSEGYFVQLTSADLAEIKQWEAEDAAAPPSNPSTTAPPSTTSATPSPGVTNPGTPPGVLFTQVDATHNDARTNITSDSYDGPLSFLSHTDAYSYGGSDSVDVAAANAVNPLIATSSGADLLTGSTEGTSVLDAGSGVNIDQDVGNGQTTFVQNGYVAGPTWDFLKGFHGADEDIMFGYIPDLSTLTFAASAGLGPVTGATVTLSPGNGSSEAVTFVGASLSELHGCSADIGGVPSWILWT